MPNIYHDMVEIKKNKTFDWFSPLFKLKYNNQTLEYIRLRRIKWRYAKQKQLYIKYQKSNNNMKKVNIIKNKKIIKKRKKIKY